MEVLIKLQLINPVASFQVREAYRRIPSGSGGSLLYSIKSDSDKKFDESCCMCLSDLLF